MSNLPPGNAYGGQAERRIADYPLQFDAPDETGSWTFDAHEGDTAVTPAGAIWTYLAGTWTRITGTMRWRGTWVSNIAYLVNDVVINDGITYIATAENTGHEPPDVAYWTEFGSGYVLLTSASEQDIASGITISDYLRVGSGSTPANVTDGDITGIRLELGGNTAFGTAHLARTGGTLLAGTQSMTNTAAGAIAAVSFEIGLNPASNSASEFRSLNFALVLAPSTGVTLATVEGGFFEVVNRSDAAITEADGLVVRPYILDSSSPATVGTIATVRGLYIRRFQRPSGSSTGAITSYAGVEFSTDGGAFITGLTTLRDIYIRNPGASTTITTHVGIEIDTLSRAGTNIGIRNANDMLNGGYLRVGSTSAPANTTAGDLTCVRFTTSNSTFGTSGEFIRCSNTLTSTASGVDGFYTFQGTINNSSASSTEFRAFSMVTLSTATNTVNIQTAAFFQNILRSASATTTVRGVHIILLDLDGSSAATVGTVSTATGILIRTFDGVTTSAITITTLNAIHISADPSSGASGVTIGTWRGLYIEDRPSGVTVTLQVGVDIEKQTRASTNIGLRNASSTVFTPSTAQNITAAGTTLLADATVIKLTANNSYTLTSTPTIADGQDGQVLVIVNVDSTDVITLQDQGTLASSNLRLSANTVALGPRDSIILMYSSDVGDWVQIGGVNVL